MARGFVRLATQLSLATLSLSLLLSGCGDDSESTPTPTGSAAGGTGGTGGNVGGSAGSGGSDPCGGCQDPTPYCDTSSSTCVACLDHSHCTDVAAARCDNGSCVPCENSTECAGIADAEICEDGNCVECNAGDDSACGATETCDLVAFSCVGVGPGSVPNCEACTNDDQCEADHRCIAMDFEQNPHGYYCLEEPTTSCSRPFGLLINRASINGAAATDYCGIEEDLATCEAVLALVHGWVCTGTDGMCSETVGTTEEAVPGALCEQVSGLADQCTYACGSVPECPGTGPGASCGTGSGNPPGWCGG